jgi:hypothetical protein
MNPDELRSLITGGTLAAPFDIATQSGEVYTVADQTNVFVTGAYPETLIIAIPKEGVVFVRLDSITAVHAEHQAVASGKR